MVAAILLVGVAQRLKIPYPLALVIGGALIGFIPGLEDFLFDPNLILMIVLPPILNYAAFWTSLKTFKENWRSIFSLALGLVFVTTLVVGLLFKWLFPEWPFALAFAFGAIVSPPDAAAATTILKPFALGKRLQAVLEGESLVNDASALVLYKLAVVALLTSTFSWTEGVFEFVKVSLGGCLIGFLTGPLLNLFSRKYLSAIVGVLFSLVIPYFNYLLADALGVSGVLAVVVSALIGSSYIVSHHSALRRVVAVTVWDIFSILMNCFIFTLIGLTLSVITRRMTGEQIVVYAGYGVLITFVLIFVRMSWVYANYFISSLKKRVPVDLLREGIVLGWAGMRGIISLTAVLALPYTMPDGQPLPGRDAVVFITFTVIFLTLLIPGITFPAILRHLKIKQISEESAIDKIRKTLLDVALKKVESFQNLNEEEKTFISNYFYTRFLILEISSSGNKELMHLETSRRKVLEAQRKRLLEMWENNETDDKLLKVLELELDVEESLTIRAEID